MFHQTMRWRRNNMFKINELVSYIFGTRKETDFEKIIVNNLSFFKFYEWMSGYALSYKKSVSDFEFYKSRTSTDRLNESKYIRLGSDEFDQSVKAGVIKVTCRMEEYVIGEMNFGILNSILDSAY